MVEEEQFALSLARAEGCLARLRRMRRPALNTLTSAAAPRPPRILYIFSDVDISYIGAGLSYPVCFYCVCVVGVQHACNAEEEHTVPLTDGAFLVMAGAMQHSNVGSIRRCQSAPVGMPHSPKRHSVSSPVPAYRASSPSPVPAYRASPGLSSASTVGAIQSSQSFSLPMPRSSHTLASPQKAGIMHRSTSMGATPMLHECMLRLPCENFCIGCWDIDTALGEN